MTTRTTPAAGPVALATVLVLAAAGALAHDSKHAVPAAEHATHGGEHGMHDGHAKPRGEHGTHDEHAKHGGEHGTHDEHAKHGAQAAAGKEMVETRIELRDRTLVDQDGRELSFVRDAVGDRIVVMDFVFTSCTNVCPILSAVMRQVQDSLGERAGNDVRLLSLTVDPIRDTPQRLKAYAAKHRAGPGWTWLTGPKTEVEDVLNGLGAYSVNFEDHPPMVVVGDPRSGRWYRFFGFPSPKRIVAQVEKLEAARKAPGS